MALRRHLRSLYQDAILPESRVSLTAGAIISNMAMCAYRSFLDSTSSDAAEVNERMYNLVAA